MNRLAIIIPCYNGWEYLKKLLEKLEKQTRLPDQIIIGDDCSTDDSYSQVLKFCNNNTKLNILVFQNKNNSGPGVTRKNALEYVNTEYVTFCDCDDYYEDDFVEDIINNINEDVDVLMFDHFVDKGKKTIKMDSTKSIINRNSSDILALSQMSLCKIVAKKSILDCTYFPPLFNCEDGAVVLQILFNSKNTVILEKAYYHYVFRSLSQSNNVKLMTYKGFLDAFLVVEETLKDCERDVVEFIGIKYICYSAILNLFKGRNKKEVAIEIINEFNTKYPNWINNKYIKSLSKFKRLFLNIVYKRKWFLIINMCKLHAIITK